MSSQVRNDTAQRQPGGEPSGPIVLPETAEQFLLWMAVERGRATNTLTAYRRDLGAYVGWLEDRGLDLSSAADDDIVDYVAHLGNRAVLDPCTRI